MLKNGLPDFGTASTIDPVDVDRVRVNSSSDGSQLDIFMIKGHECASIGLLVPTVCCIKQSIPCEPETQTKVVLMFDHPLSSARCCIAQSMGTRLDLSHRSKSPILMVVIAFNH